MNLLRKIKTLTIGLLLPATFLLFFNNSTNKHVHILPDGQLIEIAHPFSVNCKNSEKPAKTSSKKELIILTQIFHVFSGEVIIFGIVLTILEIIILKTNESKTHFSKINILQKNGRSPPFLLS